MSLEFFSESEKITEKTLAVEQLSSLRQRDEILLSHCNARKS